MVSKIGIESANFPENRSSQLSMVSIGGTAFPRLLQIHRGSHVTRRDATQEREKRQDKIKI
jgi:hypothetical protein